MSCELERKAEQREYRGRVEEEGELDDAAVLDLEHLESPRLVTVAGRGRLVLPEGGRAVCRDRRDYARAAAADAGAEPPLEDIVAAAQPELVRRHRLRRVL